jgi:6-phosphogluconolactonase (cycloisomerase 2 family)
MKNLLYMFSMFLLMMAFKPLYAQNSPYVVVTTSNGMNSNDLLVYTMDGKLMQTVPTQGKGGVPANMVGGSIAKMNDLVAVVNYNSQNVSLFSRQGSSFKLMQVIPAMSKPVSLAFGHNHLYILGTTTIESHMMNGNFVMERPDGSSRLLIGDGSGAQVGVLPSHLIISERSNTIELVELRNGIVTAMINPVQLPPPPDNDTPVGLVTRGDTAYVTIAHSDKVGIVKNGKLMSVLSTSPEKAPCWVTLSGQWLYSTNTPSKSITKFKVTDTGISIAELVAAKTQLEPSDVDAEGGVLATLSTGGGAAQLNFFQIDMNGNLKPMNTVSTSNTANGIAVINLQTPMNMNMNMQQQMQMQPQQQMQMQQQMPMNMQQQQMPMQQQRSMNMQQGRMPH